ncbi:MAG TPA: site-specific DNA-methyltransferase [Sedimentibacter sp.]|nr:site-specific DNA-methyltransferase [Sedimentibacter sp.]
MNNENKNIEKLEMPNRNTLSATSACYVPFKIDGLTIINDDCLNCIDSLPPVHLVVTDPFYGSGGRDGSVHLNDDNIIGNRMSADSLIWFVKQYSKKLYEKTFDDSHCYIFSDWRKYKDIQIAFETSGWELRSLIVWDKGNGMGEFWRSTHEFILFFTKRKPRKLTHGGCMNVLRFAPVRGNKLHPSEKPIELLGYLIEASSNVGETVLDCFAGSGSTLEAARKLGRKAVGIELSQKYYEVMKNRLSQTEMLN